MSFSAKISHEELFRLVKSMTKYERNSFLAEMDYSPSIDFKANHKALFREFSKARSYSSLSSRKAKKAANQSELVRFLFYRIFEWMAIRDHTNRWELTMVKQMIALGFVTNAISVLQKEAQKAWETKNLFYLRELYQEREKIQSHYNFDVSFNATIPTEEDTLAEIGIIVQAESLYKSLKLLSKKPIDERLKSIHKYKSDITLLDSTGLQPQTKVAVLKAKATWFILARDFAEGTEYYQKIQSVYSEGDFAFPLEEQIRQGYLTSLLMINEKRFAEAEKAIFRLGSIAPENEVQRKNLLTNWVFSAIFLSVYSGGVALGKRALKELPDIENYFSQARKIRVLHCACTLSIYEGDWEKVIETQDRISRTMKGVPVNFKAAGYLLKVLGYYETDDYIQAKRELYKFQRITKKLELRYPEAVCNLFKELMAPKSDFSNASLIFSGFLSKVETFKSHLKEEYIIQILDLTAWAKSKFHRQSIVSLISENNSLAMVRINLVS